MFKICNILTSTRIPELDKEVNFNINFNKISSKYYLNFHIEKEITVRLLDSKSSIMLPSERNFDVFSNILDEHEKSRNPRKRHRSVVCKSESKLIDLKGAVK